ncbi:unnamed protein product [Soboliphyme baturini]|uniref:Movement protein n=1 Tax=Soboliphyme baturini TaxID=241478 RepID=A0A183J5B7_9BILA|nr:unnamed protein product [Soboliphyme baturini]
MSYLSPLPHRLSIRSRPRAPVLTRSFSESALVDLCAVPVIHPRREVPSRRIFRDRDPAFVHYQIQVGTRRVPLADLNYIRHHPERLQEQRRWTVRSYSTPRMGFVRSQTTNRYSRHTYEMEV